MNTNIHLCEYPHCSLPVEKGFTNCTEHVPAYARKHPLTGSDLKKKVVELAKKAPKYIPPANISLKNAVQQELY